MFSNTLAFISRKYMALSEGKAAFLVVPKVLVSPCFAALDFSDLQQMQEFVEHNIHLFVRGISVIIT